MDEKYCIKRTKMNKKGHFAYNLGIWLGLLSGTPLVRLQSGRPAVSHFFRGVTDFFMPKHCIYFFHILLSRRFIFLRCGKS